MIALTRLEAFPRAVSLASHLLTPRELYDLYSIVAAAAHTQQQQRSERVALRVHTHWEVWGTVCVCVCERLLEYGDMICGESGDDLV